MNKLEILTGTQTVNNYPYGSLKCTITFDIEFKKGKGFRMKSQTINPKTGRTNAPKYTTYSDFMVLHKDENGHVKPLIKTIRGIDDFFLFLEFIKENEIKFNVEQSLDMWMNTLQTLRISATYMHKKEGYGVNSVLSALKFTEMIEKFEKEEPFESCLEINFDIDKINEIKL